MDRVPLAQVMAEAVVAPALAAAALVGALDAPLLSLPQALSEAIPMSAAPARAPYRWSFIVKVPSSEAGA
jgi:hypothetical protein